MILLLAYGLWDNRERRNKVEKDRPEAAVVSWDSLSLSGLAAAGEGGGKGANKEIALSDPRKGSLLFF